MQAGVHDGIRRRSQAAATPRQEQPPCWDHCLLRVIAHPPPTVVRQPRQPNICTVKRQPVTDTCRHAGCRASPRASCCRCIATMHGGCYGAHRSVSPACDSTGVACGTVVQCLLNLLLHLAANNGPMVRRWPGSGTGPPGVRTSSRSMHGLPSPRHDNCKSALAHHAPQALEGFNSRCDSAL
jgi:hypothetical protein